MHARRVIGCCSLYFLLMATTVAAQPVTAIATWSFPAINQGFTGQLFEGEASLSFDKSVVPPSGSFFIAGPPDTFSMTPSTIGTTVFSASNVEMLLEFEDGVFDGAWIGGAAIGDDTSTRIATAEDDFLLLFEDLTGDGVFGELSVGISVATESGIEGISIDDGASGIVVFVPEPTSAGLAAAFTVFGLGCRRTRPLSAV